MKWLLCPGMDPPRVAVLALHKGREYDCYHRIGNKINGVNSGHFPGSYGKTATASYEYLKIREIEVLGNAWNQNLDTAYIILSEKKVQ